MAIKDQTPKKEIQNATFAKEAKTENADKSILQYIQTERFPNTFVNHLRLT